MLGKLLSILFWRCSAVSDCDCNILFNSVSYLLHIYCCTVVVHLLHFTKTRSRKPPTSVERSHNDEMKMCKWFSYGFFCSGDGISFKVCSSDVSTHPNISSMATQDTTKRKLSLRWRHNDHAGVSNHKPHGCLLYRLFRRKSKKTSKLRVTGLCMGNSPGTGEFPAQMASYAENVSIWWRHYDV